MKCQFEHHEEYGKELTCEKCRGPLTCGPFMHSCEKCNPEDFKPCRVCGARVIDCCC